MWFSTHLWKYLVTKKRVVVGGKNLSKSVSGYCTQKKFQRPLSSRGGKGLSGPTTKKKNFCGFLKGVIKKNLLVVNMSTNF